MAKLTDKTLAQSTAITPTTLIHIVTTGDTSQSQSGSSYKAELQQLTSVFSGLSFTGGSGNCITDLYVTNIHSCSPLNINPLDEGNIYIGSNSGFTYDIVNESTLLKGPINVQSDTLSLSSMITASNNSSFKGSIKSFSHTGTTASLNYNPNTSGQCQVTVGTNIVSNKQMSLSYYGDDYVRPVITPVNGINFYKNKGVIAIGRNSNGMIINISPTGDTGNLWFEQNGNSIMYLKGGPLSSDGSLGLMLNPDGTEEPTANLQIGGTGTTGTFKYVDGNQLNGYVLTSDNDGNAGWQQQTGYQYYSAVTVTSGQVLTLNSIPVEILPQPGVDKYYDFKVYFEYNYETTSYVSGNVCIVDSTGDYITKQFDIQGTNDVALVSDMEAFNNNIPLNSNLSLFALGADPTLGDGSIKVKIYYNIVNFG